MAFVLGLRPYPAHSGLVIKGQGSLYGSDIGKFNLPFNNLKFGESLTSISYSKVVLFPDPNPRVGKGLVTLERFLGCTGA